MDNDLTVESTHRPGTFLLPSRRENAMSFYYDEKELIKNPCVYKVSQWKLTLRTDFRIELFKLWKNGEMEAMEQKLKDNGLIPGVIEPNYAKVLIRSFKSSGYPVHKCDELVFCPDVIMDHPLIRSGKFEISEKGHRLQMTKLFEKELFSKFPEISVEEGLKLAGVDPVDVGYQRIFKIQRSFEERAQQMYLPGEKNEGSHDGASEAGNGLDFDEDEYKKLLWHPYVQGHDGTSIILAESFYNESYLIADVGIDRLIRAYELPAGWFSNRDRLLISAKLHNWNPTDVAADDTDKQVCRIQKERIRLLAGRVADNFGGMRQSLPDMTVGQKRAVAKWIDTLPRDPWGYYTTRRILETIGFSKSTYYELLHNEDYGNGAGRRQMRDDEDILSVRKVAEYKGYKKGYRQISMMMEDITGKTMSPHRVLYLMRKYGMRTNIRKAGRNRKALKELMQRNGKPNLLMRRFRLHRPNEVRLTDVTYLDYGGGQRAYASASIDPVTGKLICFVVSGNNDLQLALDTLEAMDEYPLKSGGIIHSDQGILYFTDDFQEAVAGKGLAQSMSRRGNCWDNAPQESFFGHFKDECDYKKCRDLEELRLQIDDYRVYYNGTRRLWERGRMTPLEYEAYLSGMDEDAFAAYMEREEALYLKRKEKSAQDAIEKAKGHKKEIEKRLEEIGNETGRETEVLIFRWDRQA